MSTDFWTTIQRQARSAWTALQPQGRAKPGRSVVSSGILSVLKREIKVKLSKGFVITTILIPVVMAAIVGIQVLIAGVKSDAKADITVVTETGAPLEAQLRTALGETEWVRKGLYTISYLTLPKDGFDGFLEQRRPQLLEDDRRGIFVIPGSALQDKKVQFYSTNTANNEVRLRIGGAINKALNLSFFATHDIHNVDLGFIQTDIDIHGRKVSASGTQAESWGPLIVGGVMALMLLLGVTFNSMPVMNDVVGEKSTRVYEVLLSSLTPGDLLWGKIFGTVSVAALQMLIWVAAGICALLLLDNFVDVSTSMHIDFKPLLFAYYFLDYVAGLMIFLTLYAGLSALFDNPSTASSTLLPLYFVILFPFYTVFTLLGNPNSFVCQILSIVPLTSLYVMPARMSLVDVPVWQPLIALAGNLAIAYGANFVAGKVHRVAVLSTGSSPSLRQVAEWVRSPA